MGVVDLNSYIVKAYTLQKVEVNARSAAEAKGKGLRAALRQGKSGDDGFVLEVQELHTHRRK